VVDNRYGHELEVCPSTRGLTRSCTRFYNSLLKSLCKYTSDRKAEMKVLMKIKEVYCSCHSVTSSYIHIMKGAGLLLGM